MDAFSLLLCFDITSLAHCDAVRGERHPPHFWALPLPSIQHTRGGLIESLQWPSNNHALAAIDVQRCTVDKTGLFRGEIGDGGGYIINCSMSPDRD